jgi:hypothetical protein
MTILLEWSLFNQFIFPIYINVFHGFHSVLGITALFPAVF